MSDPLPGSDAEAAADAAADAARAAESADAAVRALLSEVLEMKADLVRIEFQGTASARALSILGIWVSVPVLTAVMGHSRPDDRIMGLVVVVALVCAVVATRHVVLER